MLVAYQQKLGIKEEGDLRMNALIEPKFCILEKSWIVCSPTSLQAKKVLQIQFCVFACMEWDEM